MGKKKDHAPPTDVRALTHNPFAQLAAARDLPAPAREQPEPRPSVEPPPASSKATRSGGRLVLRRETKHRGGKAVVIVTGFGALAHYDETATRALAQQLKHKLGCGGTVEARESGLEIVLQGDHPAKVAELLRGLGFRVDGVTK